MKDNLNYNNNQESELGILEYLKYIPKLLEKIEALEKEIASIKDAVVPELDLTRASGVIKYLNISKSTLDRKIREGELKKGVHFIQNGIGENRRYIPTAIQEYKKNKNKFKVKEHN